MEQAKNMILGQIARIKHRLWVKQLLETAALGLLVGGGVAALLALFSVFRPVPYLYLWEGAILAAGLLAGSLAGLYKLPTDRDAAKRMDSFGLKERIVTALEFQDREDALSVMQRQDAFRALEAKKAEIKIPVYTKYKRLGLAIVMIGVAMAISLIPSPAKKEAENREKAQLLVKETQKEIKKAEDALAQISEAELTEEQKRQLQEMRQLLAESKASLGKVKTPEQAGKESAKAEYNFAEMSKQLVMMAQNSGGGNSKELEKAAREIDDEAAGQMAQNGNGQEPGSNPESGGDEGGNTQPDQPGTGSTNENPGDQNGQNDGGESQNGGNQSGKDKDGNGNGNGNENGSNENNGAGGENGGGNEEGSGSQKGNGGNEDGGGGNQSGNNGSGSGEGNGSGGSEGNGNGSGNGESDGSAGGDSSGGGDGQGGSGQSDFGSGTGQHDYVSIPKKTGDDENLTGKNQGEGDSDIYRQQNGLSWEGEHVDGQAVIKEYAQKAYDGISRGEYPEGMEDVIKQYFNGF